MLHHVIHIAVEGTTLTGAREVHDTLVIVPSAAYLDGTHYQDAFDHARGAGLLAPYRVVLEYPVLACTPARARSRSRRHPPAD